MAEGATQARRAAELMALLCSNQGTERVRDELASLLATQRITLADFHAALSDLADERGALSDEWEQDAAPALTHKWSFQRAEDVPQEGGTTQLDVVLCCAHCAAVVTFKVGAVPPCQPGWLWRYTGQGWQRDEEKAGG